MNKLKFKVGDKVLIIKSFKTLELYKIGTILKHDYLYHVKINDRIEKFDGIGLKAITGLKLKKLLED